MVEYRAHADETLQAEIRYYVRKDGTAKERGTYLYFRYHEDGKQKELYLAEPTARRGSSHGSGRADLPDLHNRPISREAATVSRFDPVEN